MEHDHTAPVPAGYEAPTVEDLGDFAEVTRGLGQSGGDFPLPRLFN